jgi:hypothetical protein
MTLFQRTFAVTFLLLTPLLASPIIAVAEPLTATQLEKEYSLLDEQLVDKSEQLREITRQYGATRKSLRDLKDEIDQLEQDQLKAELSIKKITMFEASDGELNAEQREELRQAKYEKRKEEVKLRQLKKKYQEDSDVLQEISIKKTRLEKAVASLNEQKIAIENKTAFQQRQADKLAAEQAAKERAAKEAARQRWLEKERIRKAALAKQQAREQAARAKAKAAQQAPQKMTAEQALALLEAQAKKKHQSTRLSPEEAVKQQQALQNIKLDVLPADLRAIIEARTRALTPTDKEPNLGYLAELKLDLDDKPQSLGFLYYLGNQQYMHTFTLQEGYQHYIVGALKYTKRIPGQFNNQKGVLIINASNANNPEFDLYPASASVVDHFTF